MSTRSICLLLLSYVNSTNFLTIDCIKGFKGHYLYYYPFLCRLLQIFILQKWMLEVRSFFHCSNGLMSAYRKWTFFYFSKLDLILWVFSVKCLQVDEICWILPSWWDIVGFFMLPFFHWQIIFFNLYLRYVESNPQYVESSVYLLKFQQMQVISWLYV